MKIFILKMQVIEPYERSVWGEWICGDFDYLRGKARIEEDNFKLCNQDGELRWNIQEFWVEEGYKSLYQIDSN